VQVKLLSCAAVCALSSLVAATPAFAARDQVKVAGSSTVLPYANIVAEEFGKMGKFKAPIVESGGTGAGIKQFCAGLGEDKIDIANASRAIKAEERAECEKNGVKEIIEVKFGYDGIVFATDAKGPDFALTPKDVFLAIGAKVAKDGALVDNASKTLKEVNAAMPDWPVAFFIPGEKHGTREVFEQKLLVAGCKESGARELMEKANADAKKEDIDKMCAKVRKDGAATDIDGDYSETLARLSNNKQAVGVFGLSFYENNTDKLKVATVGGIVPSVETVSKGEYPVSRPLYFYVKKAHIGAIPGLKEFTEFFVSNKMAGPKGPLARYGLVTAPAAELKATEAAVKAGDVMK
jgi:phosphate transport system substrate-binding protein